MLNKYNALFNLRHVLTAAHCFCRGGDNGIKCKEVKTDGLMTHQPDYNVNKKIRVITGINNMKVSDRAKDPKAIYKPSKVE
jgi:hypothetical protein